MFIYQCCGLHMEPYSRVSRYCHPFNEILEMTWSSNSCRISCICWSLVGKGKTVAENCVKKFFTCDHSKGRTNLFISFILKWKLHALELEIEKIFWDWTKRRLLNAMGHKYHVACGLIQAIGGQSALIVERSSFHVLAECSGESSISSTPYLLLRGNAVYMLE